MDEHAKAFLHQFRKDVDANINLAETALASYSDSTDPLPRREMAIVRTKLQEAKMWLGKCLEVIGSELPAEFRDKAE